MGVSDLENLVLQPAAVTSTQLWQATAVAAAVDLVVVGVLWWRVSRDAFERLRVWFPSVAAGVWALIYGVAALSAWESCYQYVFPAWVRWGAWLYGLSHALLAFLFWWVGKRARIHPVLILAVLGGLHSLPGHLHGIYGRGLLEVCPPVRGVSAGSALTFGVFEFAFYWMVVLVIALGLRRLAMRETGTPVNRLGTMCG
jgi:hypothetical protein